MPLHGEGTQRIKTLTLFSFHPLPFFLAAYWPNPARSWWEREPDQFPGTDQGGKGWRVGLMVQVGERPVQPFAFQFSVCNSSGEFNILN